ncbi:MAG TPA: 4-hydroxy-tetrahydrodipicolinate synthase, partial [Lachnospiraceae bacterium]|nr:4-hydroxy-tetrahydrodipicolinate synthase [Lachnospiraceae bacterium]
MIQQCFRGACTALITPMKENGDVDFEAMGRLIDWQIEQGINAILIAGTSGEGSTLSDEEHRQVLKFSAERIAGRVPALAGTGSNDTAYACDLTRYACEVGFDACLVVTPYYNKTTQRGLKEMYKAIAAASAKPLILYNIPSRTGVNILPDTLNELADIPNIIGVKEAGGNISQIAKEAQLVGDRLSIYSGNDD